jgi:hypothetical protein
MKTLVNKFIFAVGFGRGARWGGGVGVFVPLHIQVLQQFVDQHRRPEYGFEDSQHADPKCGGMADVVYQCADQPQSIDGRLRGVSINDLPSLTIILG